MFDSKPEGFMLIVCCLFALLKSPKTPSVDWFHVYLGIGNGYPMAAVVTTPEIANVMKEALHFNTFGGNAVASAIGSSVIDVIEEDKLQQVVTSLLSYRVAGLVMHM